MTDLQQTHTKYSYKTIIQNTREYLKTIKPTEDDTINAFTLSEMLSISLNVDKEEILMDLILIEDELTTNARVSLAYRIWPMQFERLKLSGKTEMSRKLLARYLLYQSPELEWIIKDFLTEYNIPKIESEILYDDDRNPLRMDCYESNYEKLELKIS